MPKKILILSMITLLFLTGCSGLKPGLDTYTMPDKKETAKVNGEAKSAIERMAAKKHVKAELSDDFVSQYMDMASFDELKTRTIAGIKATQDTASMTEKEFQLWQDIINTKRLNQYTVNDLETKKSELYEILNGMAQEKNMELSGLAEKYGMTEQDLDRFINDQSEKYVDQKAHQNTKQLCRRITMQKQQLIMPKTMSRQKQRLLKMLRKNWIPQKPDSLIWKPL